jgi:calreticulin
LFIPSVNYFEIPHFKQDIEKQWRELYEEMEKKKEAEEAKKRKEKEEAKKDDIWGLEEEDDEEDLDEEPGNDGQEGDAERAFLGKNEEIHVDQKDEL